MAETKYPIAETFASVQGEGVYAGAPMFFIRFAGCSVGKKITAEEKAQFYPIGVLPVYTEMCRTYDGRRFLCDTDYRTKEILTLTELLEKIPSGYTRICLTGGEPLIHDLRELILALVRRGSFVHIETSGTVPLPSVLSERVAPVPNAVTIRSHVWITVSPKFGALPDVVADADEVKFLVDAEFKLDAAMNVLYARPHDTGRVVWVQPVNSEHELNQDNVRRCLSILSRMPAWRLSVQMHKVIGVR